MKNQSSEMVFEAVAERDQDSLLDVVEMGLSTVVVHVNLAADPRANDGAGHAAYESQKPKEPLNVLGCCNHGKILSQRV